LLNKINFIHLLIVFGFIFVFNTIAFSVTPSVTVTLVDGGELSDDVAFNYLITDADNIAVGLKVEYNIGAGWVAATVTGDTTALLPPMYSGIITWNSLSDVNGIDLVNTLIRVTPSNANGLGTPGESSAFHLDNNLPPTLTIDTPSGENSGDILISYALSDVEGDKLSIVGEYKINGSWQVAVSITDIAAVNYNGELTWSSLDDIPGIDQTQTFFRIIVSDNDLGETAETNSFHVDNNLPPTLTIVTPTGEKSGDIDIAYTLSDAEGDDLSIVGEYNIDGSWQFVPGMTEITSANYSGELTWSSLNNVPGLDETQTFFRIIVSDNDVGETAETNSFHLDNNNTPSIFISGPAGEFRGDAVINYNIFDDENDIYGIKVEYSTNNGSSWSLADITGDTSSLAVKSGNITWHSLLEIPRFVGTSLLRVIPHDNDTGTPDTAFLFIDNIGAPALFINTAFPSELIGDYSFQYQIIDEESDSVFLDVEFRRSPSSPWINADITGELNELFPGGYTGTLIWHSDSVGQLSHEDHFQAGFRIMGRDKNPGGWFEFPDVHVDNNEIPVAISAASVPDTITGKVTIPMVISDVEGDPLSIDVQISRDGGGSWKFGTSQGESFGLLPSNYTPDFIWDSVIDLGFHLAADTRLRLAARDNDRSPFIETNDFIVHNKVGDFTGDNRIDFDDIAGFQDTWLSQDTIRETGPTTGAVPDLAVQRDGVVDFEDLLPFVQMWNWSLGSSVLKTIVEFSKSTGASALYIESMENSDNKIEIYISIPETENIWSGRLIISYDSGVNISDLSLSDSYTESRESIYIERIENSNRTAEVVVAPLDGSSLSEWKEQLVKIVFESDPKGYAGALTVTYDLRGQLGDKIESGNQKYNFEIRSSIPKEYQLLNNYPNPFNPSTTIEFELPVQGDISLTIYNLLGEEVMTFNDKSVNPGRHSFIWNGKSNSGIEVSSGIYFYSLRTGDFHSVKKMLLVR